MPRKTRPPPSNSITKWLAATSDICKTAQWMAVASYQWIPERATERQGTAKQRVYQDFFRRSVLASYDATCCVCQCDLSPLLVASHIIPWSLDVKNRLNPENGLCLCLLHDGAFDRGLLAVTGTFHIRISKSAKSSRSSFVQDAIVKYDSRPIFMPRRFRPRQEFLDWHGKNVFVA